MLDHFNKQLAESLDKIDYLKTLNLKLKEKLPCADNEMTSRVVGWQLDKVFKSDTTQLLRLEKLAREVNYSTFENEFRMYHRTVCDKAFRDLDFQFIDDMEFQVTVESLYERCIKNLAKAFYDSKAIKNGRRKTN